jgi:hypothetical protein
MNEASRADQADTGTGLPLFLWDDNPSAVDLLGFDAVVAPVLAAVRMPDLDPLTIGIHGPWGGGKSTILGLLETELQGDAHVVVRTNPWEYDDQSDVKGTLIAQVLGDLEERFREDQGVTDKIADLFKRISWSRATLALAKGALTMQWEIDTLVDAFTPRKKETAETMAGFREAFGALVDQLPRVDRVVVLVDDLDRCLPQAVMATLEAIKLFLSVKKMVFVIAADQEMVRHAIAASLGASSRSERFAQRYLDKIVQLPVSLPRLAPYEAEAYIGLLLTRGECTDEQFQSLVEHCRERRRLQRTPLLDEMKDLAYQPTDASLRLASQLAQGLGADRVTNPREIKRFLNAFGVRREIAMVRGIDLAPAVIAKLLLLEDRHRSDFEKLADTPDGQRPTLLSDWEKWAHDGAESPPPEGITDESKEWAASDPSLASHKLGPYITLAASLATVSVAGAMSEDVAVLMARVLGDSQADRGLAAEELAKRPGADQKLVVAALFERTRQTDDVTAIVRGLVEMTKANADLADDVVAGIEDHCYRRLDPASAVELGGCGVPTLVALAEKLRDDITIAEDVRMAARQILERSTG